MFLPSLLRICSALFSGVDRFVMCPIKPSLHVCGDVLRERTYLYAHCAFILSCCWTARGVHHAAFLAAQRTACLSTSSVTSSSSTTYFLTSFHCRTFGWTSDFLLGQRGFDRLKRCTTANQIYQFLYRHRARATRQSSSRASAGVEQTSSANSGRDGGRSNPRGGNGTRSGSTA